MDHNYTVTITICILSMITLSIDVGKNTILNKSDIKWFRTSFIFAAIGAICEYLGVLFDKTGCAPQKIHWLVTYIEFCISPFLAILLARSCGMKRTTKPMVIVMILNVILQTISLLNGKIFSIDENSLFQRGEEYWLYVFFCALSFLYILFVFVLIAIRAKLRNIICIILIASIMITGQTANIIDGNINSGYLSICVTAVLLYIFIQNMFRQIMMETINIEKDISSHDALTKVMSRISYNNKVKEFDKQIREEPLTVNFAICECDLNNLKLINDTFGHDSGDQYIINCCKTICDIFKHSPVYRIGGDEFVAILQSDDYENLDKIKQLVKETTESEIKKSVSLFEKKSFAAGFAIFEYGKDHCFGDVMKRADIEMYQNKRMLKSL